MHEQFMTKGPGSGVELEVGRQQMEEYHHKLSEFLKTREELGQALKLFNLPIMAYPQLSEVEQSLKDLGMIYDIFRQQQESREEWSSTLWSELEMSVMEKGMEDFDLRLKKMPKQIKALRPYKKVEDVVNAFVASLPLIQNLKNDALRDRHWRQLMEVTGISFDMNPKTFTLQKLFEMQLDRFGAHHAILSPLALRPFRLLVTRISPPSLQRAPPAHLHLSPRTSPSIAPVSPPPPTYPLKTCPPSTLIASPASPL